MGKSKKAKKNGFVANIDDRHIEVVEHPDKKETFYVVLAREYNDEFTKEDIEKNGPCHHCSKIVDDKEYSVLTFAISEKSMEALVGCYLRTCDERLEHERLKSMFEGENNG